MELELEPLRVREFECPGFRVSSFVYASQVTSSGSFSTHCVINHRSGRNAGFVELEFVTCNLEIGIRNWWLNALSLWHKEV